MREFYWNISELINFKDSSGQYCYSFSSGDYDVSMMEMLIQFPPEIISSARNNEGDTALYLGQSYNSCYENIPFDEDRSLHRNGT